MLRFLRITPLIVAGVLASSCQANTSPTETNPSLVGRQVSAPQFDGWVRKSEYLTMRDGVRIAIDYYRPTKAGVLHEDPLPVVWEHTPYHRFRLNDEGQVGDELRLGPMAEGAERLIRHGYVFASADVRGYGASFGARKIWIGPQQAEDAYDITEWLASQVWSTGAIGMTGRSYLGTVQYFAAAGAPPHLKAIFAEMGGFDNYNIFYTNGIYRSDLPMFWRLRSEQQDFLGPISPGRFRPNGVAPVDADTDGSLLATAIQEHQSNSDLPNMVSKRRFRDDVDPDSGLSPHFDASPWMQLEGIERSNIAIYHRAGWFDMYANDALLYANNLGNPQKAVIGPWYHREHFGFDVDSERLAWFDYWLKGIDSGVMDRPRIRYFVIGEAQENGWRASDAWPPEEVGRSRWYLNGRATDAIQRKESGTLSATLPTTESVSDTLQVDYEFSLGGTVQRNNGLWPRRQADCAGIEAADWCWNESGYPDHSATNSPQLSYESDVLTEDMTMVGHAVVHLWMTANQDDTDVFVIIEEVHPDGRIQYVSQTGLRTSHRVLNDPPFENFGLPWHGNYSADESLLPSGPVEIVLTFPPTTNVFDRGNKIRLTISGADAGSRTSSSMRPGASITVLRNSSHTSYVDLPIELLE